MFHSASLPAAVSSTLAAALFGCVSTLSAQIPQPEPYVPESLGLIAPGQHVGGPGGSGDATISPVGDIDIFGFDYVAGETIWFQGYQTGCLDLQLRVLDPLNGFNVVASSSCPGWNPWGCIATGCAVVLGPSLNLQAGPYLLEVSDIGSNQTGSYVVSMHRVVPSVGPMLANAQVVTDTIAPHTDVDMLGFDVVQNSLVNLWLRTNGCLDLEYRVLDATGNVVVAPSVISGNDPWGCIVNQVSINPFAGPAPATGRYWIVLRDSGLDETGTYDVQVQCLYSPTGCPSSAGNFTLAMTQPTGHGSLAIDVTNGTPDAPYITAFTFDAINTSAPHTGWFGGLHISFPELGGVMGLGFPFLGLLDPEGESHFATAFPFGPFPPLWAVSVELSPGYLNLVRATPVLQVTLQ